MRRRRRSTTLTGAALDDELYELAMAAVWMESPLALFNAEISRRLRQAFHSIQIRPSAPHYTSIQLRSIDSHPDNNGTLIAGRQGKVRFHCCLVSCAVECICMLFDRIRLNILNGQKRCVKAVRAASTLKTTASRVCARVRLHFLEGAAANLSFCKVLDRREDGASRRRGPGEAREDTYSSRAWSSSTAERTCQKKASKLTARSYAVGGRAGKAASHAVSNTW